MTGYQSKKAAAQDKLTQPAQEAFNLEKNLLARCETEMRYAGWTTLETDNPQRQELYIDVQAWFEWWRVSKVADETEAEIDFADFLIIAQAVVAKLKEHNNG